MTDLAELRLAYAECSRQKNELLTAHKLAAADNAALLAECDRLREDAERYRWMRDVAWHKCALLGLIERYGPFEWDDAIDEARGEK